MDSNLFLSKYEEDVTKPFKILLFKTLSSKIKPDFPATMTLFFF